MGMFRDFFTEAFRVGFKDPVLKIVDAFGLNTYETRKQNAIYSLNHAPNTKRVGFVWNTFDDELKADTEVKAVYESRTEELNQSGLKEDTDLALTYLGRGIAGGIWHVTHTALPKIEAWIDTFGDAYHIKTDEMNNLKKLAETGEFGLNAVVSFILGVSVYPAVMRGAEPVWEAMSQEVWKKLPNTLLDIPTAVRLGYVFPGEKAVVLEDLRRHGLNEERIKLLEKAYLFYPSPSDLVTWQAREVFEPDAVSKYGLADELEAVDKEPFYKAGMNDEQIANFWKAHWVHPSFTQMQEMYWRDLITKADFSDWFRLVEVPPYWRDKMIDMTNSTLTRVDVRRIWCLGGKDEDWLRTQLKRIGYFGDAQDEMVTFYNRYKLEHYRDLTKSVLIKGVKKGLLTKSEAKDRLIEMDYIPEDAAFIIAVELAQESPDVEAEYREITQRYRTAIHEKAYSVPGELITIEKKLKDVEDKLLAGKEDKAPDSYIKAMLKQKVYLELQRDRIIKTLTTD